MKTAVSNANNRPGSDIIRIPEAEYGGIPDNGFLTHFVLPPTTVLVGTRYALARIMEAGFDDVGSGTGKAPLLSYENIYIGECILVVQRITYEALTHDDFMHSLWHIPDAVALRHYMLKRYGASRPHLSPEQILERGVSKILLTLHRYAT